MFAIHLDAPALPSNDSAIQMIVTIKHRSLVGDTLFSANFDKIASIIKIPPPTQPPAGELSYEQLACSEIDKQKITRLITTMAENGKLALLLKYQRELRQIGREIDHVHPLKFLSTVFSNPTLKVYMKEIYHDYFKWTNFMDGLGNGLTSQAKQGKVGPYINEFAKEVGAQPDALQGYVQSMDWENMVVFLMNN